MMGKFTSIKADVLKRCLDLYDLQLGHRGYSPEELRRRTDHLREAFDKYSNLKWLDLNRFDDDAIARLTLDLDLRGVEVEKLGLADKLPARTDLYNRWFNLYLSDSKYQEYVCLAQNLSTQAIQSFSGASYDMIFKHLNLLWNLLKSKNDYPDAVWFYMITVESLLQAIVAQELDECTLAAEYRQISLALELVWQKLEPSVSAAKMAHANSRQHDHDGLWNELQYLRMYLQFKAKSQLEQQVRKLAEEQYPKLPFIGYWWPFTKNTCGSTEEALLMACELLNLELEELSDPNRNRIIGRIKKIFSREHCDSPDEIAAKALDQDGTASAYMTSKTFRQLAEVCELLIALHSLGLVHVHFDRPLEWICGFLLLFDKNTDIKVQMSRVDNPSAGNYSYSIRQVAKELIGIRVQMERGETFDFDYRHEALLHYWSLLLGYFGGSDIEKFVEKGEASKQIQNHCLQLLQLGDSEEIFEMLRQYLELLCTEFQNY